MSKVLYIKANSKPEGESRTFMISDAFIEAYREAHPDDEIVTIDLYKEDIRFIDYHDMDEMFGPNKLTDEHRKHPIARYAYEFAEADKYVVAAPMWNLGVPAILKAYFDYVSISGITFKYTSGGPIGLLNGKKAINIVTRGGDYTEEQNIAFEFTDSFVKAIMAFYGVLDYTSIAADNTDVSSKDPVGCVNRAIEKAIEVAKTF
jgi:FMN-dependent NADH-azoreductase